MKYLISFVLLLTACGNAKAEIYKSILEERNEQFSQEIIQLHERCQYEVREGTYIGHLDIGYKTENFVCDSIFWEYFCTIYPMNPKCNPQEIEFSNAPF